jgi:hypothetical protein
MSVTHHRQNPLECITSISRYFLSSIPAYQLLSLVLKSNFLFCKCFPNDQLAEVTQHCMRIAYFCGMDFIARSVCRRTDDVNKRETADAGMMFRSQTKDLYHSTHASPLRDIPSLSWEDPRVLLP